MLAIAPAVFAALLSPIVDGIDVSLSTGDRAVSASHDVVARCGTPPPSLRKPRALVKLERRTRWFAFVTDVYVNIGGFGEMAAAE